MFTGIIEDVGTVDSIGAGRLDIATLLDDVAPGDSVAVNGTCLTAVRIAPQAGRGAFILSFDFSPETGRRTSLEGARPGTRVNLERALRVGGRVGGHFLTGHVEGTGRLQAVARADNSFVLTFAAQPDVLRYVVPKGSVGVDGISLTVTAADDSGFSVSVIPHTMKNTTLAFRKKGDIVNLEPDILAKYVERFLNSGRSGGKGLTAGFLAENGFA